MYAHHLLGAPGTHSPRSPRSALPRQVHTKFMYTVVVTMPGPSTALVPLQSKKRLLARSGGKVNHRCADVVVQHPSRRAPRQVPQGVHRHAVALRRARQDEIDESVTGYSPRPTRSTSTRRIPVRGRALSTGRRASGVRGPKCSRHAAHRLFVGNLFPDAVGREHQEAVLRRQLHRCHHGFGGDVRDPFLLERRR